MQLAEKHDIDSIAFPAISTGFFGYPMGEAAEVALKTVSELIPSLRKVKRIRFVLRRPRDLEVHERVLDRILEGWKG